MRRAPRLAAPARRLGRVPEIAVFAPMKPPDDPVPSGDREIARLTLEALRLAGYAPRLASRLKLRDGAGDAGAQARLTAAAAAEADRLTEAFGPARPLAWLTYHCYHKAPDLIGPVLADRLNLPYAISEPSISPKRRAGPWAGFAAASEAAIARADRLLWTTARDRPALAAAGHSKRMLELPPFLNPGPPVPPRDAGTPLQLLTVAMMRSGDKLESYRRLAAGLAHLSGAWELTVIGDGPAEPAVRALLARFSGRSRWRGSLTDPAALRAAYERADLLLWPGVAEGVGMVWLEAQAAGLPVVAEDGPAARDTVAAPLAAPDDPAALAAAIAAAGADRRALSAAARDRVETRHSLSAAANRLGETLRTMIR